MPFIKLEPDPTNHINPFELEQHEELNRKDILVKLKELYSLHSKFADEINGRKLTLEELKEICKRNNFVITDNELLEIIGKC